MQTDTKEVYFYMYCNTCKFEQLKEYEDPCHDCLNTPANINSHKPVNYEER
jgi:hypothetical protein